MRKLNYRGDDGRMFAVWLPDNAPDEDAPRGVPIGPRSLEKLGLPKEVEVRLHNELWARGVLDIRAATYRKDEVIAAVMSALRVDADAIIAAWASEVEENDGTDR